MNSNKSPIPVYFSHSYKPEDRELNRFFWKLFFQNDFRFTVDPKSGNFSVSYLELMMKQSSCFAAVVTERPNQELYRCSPYILFEYGLSVQAKKPCLSFVENKVSGDYFDKETTCIFKRNLDWLEGNRNEFIKKIKLLKQKSNAYRNLDVKARGPVGFVVDPKVDSKNIYTPHIPKMRELLHLVGYPTEVIDLNFDNTLKFSLDIDKYDFIVIGIDSIMNPDWIYPFIHGRFIPSIKLLHLPSYEPINNSLPPLLMNHLIKGVSSQEDAILFWQNENELMGKFKEQLNKFEHTRTEFGTFEEGERYFRSIGRKPAYVFISNEGEVNDFSKLLSKEMNIENINHFQYQFQNNLPIGEEWQEELLEEVRKCSVFVALITKKFLESDWCKKEFELALKLREEGQLTLLPYFLEKVEGFSPLVQVSSLVDLKDAKRIDIIIQDLDTTLRKIEEKKPKQRSYKIDTTIDIAILTILPEEYKEVLRQLDSHQPAPSSKDNIDLHGWEIGEIKSTSHQEPYRVVVAMAGAPGTVTGFKVTEATFDRWKPRYVILIGIAGGLTVDGLKKGDVVIANFIWGYEYGKMDGGFQPRSNNSFQMNNALTTTAQAYAITNPQWVDTLKSKAPDNSVPVVKLGMVGSGDKVIDDLSDAFVVNILKKEPRLMAVEMEGAGAAAAIQAIAENRKIVGFSMIRGISDLPRRSLNNALSGEASQTTQRDTWKKYASETAACFAINLIRSRWIEPPFNA